MGFSVFDTDNDTRYTSKNNRYKGREGETDRLSFIWFEGTEEGEPDLSSAPKFIGAERIYHPDVGYVLNNGPEFAKLSAATGGNSPKMAVATLVIQWPTDRSGEIERSRLAKGDVLVMPWIFSKDKYASLKKTHKRFHFGAHDVTVDCSDAQYQKMTFTPERDNLFLVIREKNPDLAKRIIAQAQEVISNLENSIAQDLTIEQFKEKLGMSDFEGVKASDSDVSSIMDDILG